MNLASPSGVERFASDLSTRPRTATPSRRSRFRFWRKVKNDDANGIPIDDSTIRITHTVLGNTENPASIQANAALRIGSEVFEMSPAGLGPGENGIYLDSVAAYLRTLPFEGRREYLKIQLARFAASDPKGAKVLSSVVDGSLLVGSRTGLAYGISSGDVRDQFTSYLEGLTDRASKYGESFTVLTPSAYQLPSKLPPDVQANVAVWGKAETPPLRATPGHVHVVLVPTLPHKLFVALMSVSDMPSIVAGDGAMSAAITLGKPFAMTKVDWNKKNIFNVKKVLIAGLSREADKNLVEEIFPEGSVWPNFRRSLALLGRDYKRAFERTAESMPWLSDSIVQNAFAIRSLRGGGTSITETIHNSKDPIFVASLMQHAEAETSENIDAFVHMLRSDPSATIRALQTKLLPLRLLKYPAIDAACAEALVSQPFSDFGFLTILSGENTAHSIELLGRVLAENFHPASAAAAAIELGEVDDIHAAGNPVRAEILERELATRVEPTVRVHTGLALLRIKPTAKVDLRQLASDFSELNDSAKAMAVYQAHQVMKTLPEIGRAFGPAVSKFLDDPASTYFATAANFLNAIPANYGNAETQINVIKRIASIDTSIFWQNAARLQNALGRHPLQSRAVERELLLTLSTMKNKKYRPNSLDAASFFWGVVARHGHFNSANHRLLVELLQRVNGQTIPARILIRALVRDGPLSADAEGLLQNLALTATDSLARAAARKVLELYGIKIIRLARGVSDNRSLSETASEVCQRLWALRGLGR